MQPLSYPLPPTVSPSPDVSVLQPPIPQWYTLEVTSQCNLKCPYCPTGRGDIPMAARGYLDLDTLPVMLDKLNPHAEVIQLVNWGEPFMHKQLVPILRKIADYGIATQFSTNLTVRLFDETELADIITSGLYSLFCSIDGITQEANTAYRRNGSVTRALQNLRNLVRMKARLGARTPHLIWGFYVNAHNQHQVDDAARMAADIGVMIWFKDLSCPPEFQTSLLRTRPALFATPPDIARLWKGRFNRGLGAFALDSRLPKVCNVCRMPFEIMIINFNGDVYPCTAVTGREFVVGNLLTDTLEDIWHKRMLENRLQLLSPDLARPQSQCLGCKHFPKPVAA